MNQITRVAMVMLSLSLVAPAQQKTETRNPDRFAASVSDLKGACYVRDNNTAKPRKLKSGDELRAGQQLQCEAKATLKIRFRNSGAEKEIKAKDPDWYLIPEVPASTPNEGREPPRAGIRLAGRSKGNVPPEQTASAGAQVAPQPNVPDAGRTRTVERSASGELDVADLFWKSRQKYFLIVAASKTAGTVNDLPFTKVDARRISETLTGAGYQELGTLDDQQATRENFVTALKGIRVLPKTTVVIVYYSGHAVTDPQKTDLWLQLYGQTQFGDQQGISVSGIVTAARGGGIYQGQLSIILDTCYSGQGVLTSQLSVKEAAGTAILASSADYEPSYSMSLPNGVEMSAFTYFLLEGLGPDWEEVDSDHDGIIFYGDLQRYIRNKLLREKGVGETMEPQLLDNPKAWVAYDHSHVRNQETPARKALLLLRSREVQNPQAVMDKIGELVTHHPDAYMRALQAIKAERFEEAERLLQTAEAEDRVSDAVVFWARALVKERTNDSAGARVWYDRALAASSQRNIELIQATALANGTVGNWIRAKDLLNGILELPAEGGDSNETVLSSLFLMTFFDMLEGNQTEAELYLRRLKAVDAKVLVEVGGASLPELIEILSDIVANKRGSAKRRLEALRSSMSTRTEDEQEAIRKFDEMLAALLGSTEMAPAQAAVSVDKLREWSKSLDDHDPNSLLSLLQRLRATASNSAEMSDSLRSPEVSALLVRTVDFSNRHRSEKQKTTLNTEKGPVEIEIPGGERQSILESSRLLAATGGIYVVRRDATEAEKLFKQVISLAEEEKIGLNIVAEFVFELGSLYEKAGRFMETETLYEQHLAKVSDSLGEENIFSYGLNRRLGDLYEHWNRTEDAERSYRTLLRITQSRTINMFDTLSKETLAEFLVNHGRNEEAAGLFEQVVARMEPLRKTAPWLVGDSLADDYFQLAKSYYNLQRYEDAERSFKRASELDSNADEPDLVKQSTTLVWQWFTADKLKKPDEAARFYQELTRLIQADLAQPHPNKFLGSNLQDLAKSFREVQEFAKAEELLRVAFAVQEKVYGGERIETGHIWASLGYLDIARRRYKNAIISLKTAQSIYERQSPSPVADLSYVLYRIGFANYCQLDYEQSRLQLTRSVDLFQQAPESERSDNFSREDLARMEKLLGHYDAAKGRLKAVLEEKEKAKTRVPGNIFSDLLELVSIARLQGEREEANQWLVRAQKAAEEIDPAEFKRFWSRFDYERGIAALAQGKTREAAELLRIAVEKAEKNPKMDQPLLLDYLRDYARVMRKRGKDKEAVSIEQRAKEIRARLESER